MTTLLTRAPEHTATPPEQRPAPATASTAPARRATPAPPAVRSLPLSGELSKADVSRLEPELEQLVATGARTVEVDLSRVSHMDAAVARLLLRTSWRLGDPARALLLRHPRPQVRRVLRWYGAAGLVAR